MRDDEVQINRVIAEASASGESMVRDRVRGALAASGLHFAEGADLPGYRADFMVESPDGAKHLLEVKNWGTPAANLSRARNFAVHLGTLAEIASARVVVPTLPQSVSLEGVIPMDGIEAFLRTVGSMAPATGRSGGAPFLPTHSKGATVLSSEPPPKLVFAAMPFAEQYDDVFFLGIVDAVHRAGSVAKRVDQDDYAGDVVERIKARIAQAHAVVADLSEARPNVLYEMGFAQGAGKPVVPICSTSLGELPFDVRNLNVLPYKVGQTHKLREPLTTRLRAVLAV